MELSYFSVLSWEIPEKENKKQLHNSLKPVRRRTPAQVSQKRTLRILNQGGKGKKRGEKWKKACKDAAVHVITSSFTFLRRCLCLPPSLHSVVSSFSAGGCLCVKGRGREECLSVRNKEWVSLILCVCACMRERLQDVWESVYFMKAKNLVRTESSGRWQMQV